MIEEISIESLVDPRQIGWIRYREGDASLRVKVILAGKVPFLSHVTAYKKGQTIRTVEYGNRQIWKEKERALLSAFKKQVGDYYYYNGPVCATPPYQRR